MMSCVSTPTPTTPL
uniref:Uncharacterized protein n=1 Tax=Arundo donax TaxID=35708 RepID=A0A0A9EFJ0_ARUDO